MLLLALLISLVCSSTIQAAAPVLISNPPGLTVSGCTSDSAWSSWFNSMKPIAASRFDADLHATIQAKNGGVLCAIPRGIQVQAVEPYPANTMHSIGWHMKDGVAYGFTSNAVDVDYQVRFCCPYVAATVSTAASTSKALAQSTGASAPQATAAVAATTTQSSVPASSCGRAEIKASLQTSRIFGGSFAVPNSWPWQMLYQETKLCAGGGTGCASQCGATLLDSRHVLTAAHCIDTKNVSAITIVGGVHNTQQQDADKQQVRRVQRMFVHPGWNRELLINDIAILRLSEPIQFTRFVQPACLPGPDPKPDSTVVVVGWGSEVLGGRTIAQLKQTHMQVVGNCRSLIPTVDDSKQICIANRVGGESVCQGDSGGPILQQQNGQWYVQGVTSFGVVCKTDGNLLPNVYVRVSAYLDWIKSTMA